MRSVIASLVSQAIVAAASEGQLNKLDAQAAAQVDAAIERPKDESNGEWATTVAMRLAKLAGMKPADIAVAILAHMPQSPFIASAEVAGPGFINFRLSHAAYEEMLKDAHDAGKDFGKSTVGGKQKVQVEFVSANPTGPMHVGHGRWAALGNALCNVLDHAGWDVEREFYINDAGSQMMLLGKSVSARYLTLCGTPTEVPEGGYGGSYVIDIAEAIKGADGTKWLDVSAEEREEEFKERAYAIMLAGLKTILHDMGVDFDVWFSERSLHKPDEEGMTAVTRAFATLDAAGYLYDDEGARWFRTTDFGDDKNRVLVKADGDYTYFASDIAYHANKFDRGFTRVIDIWGADHHGYVPRMEAACAALGHPGQFEVVLGQLVNLFRDGEAVRMSKRTGEMVTLGELIDEVGADATKYLMLSKSSDQPVDFDIEVAKKQDSSNPVYYIQYAHARICSMARKAADEGVVESDSNLQLLVDESELALIRKISEFPEMLLWAAEDLAPYHLTHYAEALAASFHQFYTRCHVITEDASLSAARLYLASTAGAVLALTLGLLGVSAPERM